MAVVGSRGPEWISDRFSQREDGFYIEDVSLKKLARNCRPPFYAYSFGSIRDQTLPLQQALGRHGIEVFYSMKANPSLAVVNLLSSMGIGIEVASLGELLAVKKLAVPPEKISFAGPVKSRDALKEAIRYGIYGINAESTTELKRINQLAQDFDTKVRVGIRVNPKFEVSGTEIKMGGGPKQFGIDEEKLDADFFRWVKNLPNISLEGVHIFAATQILDTDSFLANAENSLKVAQRLNQHFPVRYLDLGGGLGIPYRQDEPKLPIGQIAQTIGGLLAQYNFLKENQTRLYFEPGRYLVGPSGIYVTRVDNVKDSRGETFVGVDGGIHHMLRPALISGSSHPVYNLSKLDQPPAIEANNVSGALCTPHDFLAKKVVLPGTEPGDLMGVLCAGAYGFTEAMWGFLSHERPPEIAISGNRWEIIRYGVHPSTFLEGQILPRGF